MKSKFGQHKLLPLPPRCNYYRLQITTVSNDALICCNNTGLRTFCGENPTPSAPSLEGEVIGLGGLEVCADKGVGKLGFPPVLRGSG